MLLNTKEFKKVCSAILTVVDNSGIDIIELKTNGSVLTLNASNSLKTANNEYYVSAKFPLEQSEELHATISANKFLKLISQITADVIEITLDSYSSKTGEEAGVLVIKANSKYKIPLVYQDSGKLLELPVINIENPTLNTTLDGDNLYSILAINSAELENLNGKKHSFVQELYYLDNEGAITFTLGACVNSFVTNIPFKVLFNSKIIKLFKLFKSEPNVEMTLGCDTDVNGLDRVKVKFDTPNVSLVAFTPTTNELLTQVPSKGSRLLANKTFPYSITFDRAELTKALNRLLLFYDKKRVAEAMVFIKIDGADFTLESETGNIEEVNFADSNAISYDTKYQFKVLIQNFCNILETCSEDYITLSFGDKRAVVVTHNNVKNIMPEGI